MSLRVVSWLAPGSSSLHLVPAAECLGTTYTAAYLPDEIVLPELEDLLSAEFGDGALLSEDSLFFGGSQPPTLPTVPVLPQPATEAPSNSQSWGLNPPSGQILGSNTGVPLDQYQRHSEVSAILQATPSLLHLPNQVNLQHAGATQMEYIQRRIREQELEIQQLKGKIRRLQSGHEGHATSASRGTDGGEVRFDPYMPIFQQTALKRPHSAFTVTTCK
ncbi:hypothetical protein WJX84_000962 [Apatococcus fuscideae]|uniref:Uncharacterized protein n=1 Tax=Apatococcus fuscideae TaxID=2026836 RepID=A0AAW1T140_9CHLO